MRNERIPPDDNDDEAGARSAKRKMEAALRDAEYWRGVYERYMGKGKFRGWDSKHAIRTVLQEHGSGMTQEDIVNAVVEEGGGHKPPMPGKASRSPESNVRSSITSLINAGELKKKQGLIYLSSSD